MRFRSAATLTTLALSLVVGYAMVLGGVRIWRGQRGGYVLALIGDAVLLSIVLAGSPKAAFRWKLPVALLIATIVSWIATYGAARRKRRLA